MPVISRFLGIAIAIVYRDHDPPHFHAVYGGDPRRHGHGTLPSPGTGPRAEWLDLHRDELMANWDRARAREPLVPIAPLEQPPGGDRMLHITDVRPTGGYRLWLRFDDGVEGEVDLGPELEGAVFAPLREAGAFARVAIDPDLRTIAWPNGADFAPEFLHDLVQQRAAA